MKREEKRRKDDPKAAIARQREEDAVQWLVEAVFFACYDWIVDGREPNLDPERNRRIVKRQMAGLAAGFRAEIARRGLTADDLDSRLGWPEGRTERLLSEPSELRFFEVELLSAELETSTGKMFPPK